VGLLFGGRSVEHEVSVVSARGVAAAMADTPLECVPIAVTRQGDWLTPEHSRAVLEGDAKTVEPPPDGDGSRVLIDTGGGGLWRATEGRPVQSIDLDVVFPLIHGWGGEDGRLQGALELAGLPYVGAGVAASAVGMDKALSKRLFESAGLPVGPWAEFGAAEWRENQRDVLLRLERLERPVFVKPCNGGSSVGIRKVADDGSLPEAIDQALGLDDRVVVEQGIDAREIECAVLGNDRPEASGPGEIIAAGEFYDYDSKYVDERSRLIIPAELEPATTREIRACALDAYRALRLRGLARVDFLLERNTGKLFLNEVNTLPGFTPISMFSKLWEAAGLSYPRLVVRLVDLALESRTRS
jgi:D-alanine-D-alanine ligase